MNTQFRLLQYIWPHWRGLTIVLVVMLFHIGLDVLHPWPTKVLIDDVFEQQAVPDLLQPVLDVLPGPADVKGLLLWVCISTVLLYIVGALMGLFSTLASTRLGQRMTYDLGAKLFLHVQRLSLLFHSRQPVGDTMTRITEDTYCVQELLTDAVIPLLESVISLVTMFVILWLLEPTMTLLSLAVVPFLMFTIWMFKDSMKDTTRERRDLEGRMMSVVEQALNAIPAVQAFTREELEHARFRSCANATIAAYLRSMMTKSWFGVIAGLITVAGTGAIMWLGGLNVLANPPKMTAGDVLVFIWYLGSLYGPINSITYTASAWQHVAANAERVLELLDIAPDVQDSPDARAAQISGHVRYENVIFGYVPDRPVLKGISFEAKPGEVVAIVGPTGAGKTTMANLLVRFFDPWSGCVTVDGQDIRHLQIRSLRQQVAIVLQEPFIFPITVAENIAYGRPDATQEEIVAAAVAASADGYIRQLPEGYDAVIGERGATLSGGEKQRLSIARAFLKNAPILILDEPTSALDARTEGFLLEALNRLMKGRTTLIIAHRLSTIRHADRILVIDHGAIVEQGRHAELMVRGGLYAGLYRQQMDIAQHDGVPEPAPAEELVTVAANGETSA